MHKGDVFTAAKRRSDRAAMPIKNPAIEKLAAFLELESALHEAPTNTVVG